MHERSAHSCESPFYTTLACRRLSRVLVASGLGTLTTWHESRRGCSHTNGRFEPKSAGHAHPLSCASERSLRRTDLRAVPCSSNLTLSLPYWPLLRLSLASVSPLCLPSSTCRQPYVLPELVPVCSMQPLSARRLPARAVHPCRPKRHGQQLRRVHARAGAAVAPCRCECAKGILMQYGAVVIASSALCAADRDAYGVA